MNAKELNTAIIVIMVVAFGLLGIADRTTPLGQGLAVIGGAALIGCIGLEIKLHYMKKEEKANAPQEQTTPFPKSNDTPSMNF